MTTPAKPRPLSPHLSIYKPQISSVMSILHRATGVALAFGLVVLVAWLVMLAAGEESYKFFTEVLRPALGQMALIMIFFVIFFCLLSLINGFVWKNRVPSKAIKYFVLFFDFVAALILAVLALNFLGDNFSSIFQPICIWTGVAVLFGLTVSFFYHFWNGIRHLIWDAGWCLSLKGMHVTGWFVVLISTFSAVMIWLKILEVIPS